MYGFCSDGFSPLPSAGAICVSNGLAATTTSSAKKAAVAPMIAMTQGISSPCLRWLVRMTTTVAAVRIVSHSISEPACEPQNDDSR